MTEEAEWRSVLKGDDPVDAQIVSDFEHFRRTQRSKLTLLQQPLLTTQKFFQGVVYALIESIKYCLSHKLFLFIFVPIFLVWLILDNIPGAYSQSVNDFEFWVQYVVWWTGLGVLSSVGLGSGLQSGVLFLFPHIFKVCLAARTCNTVDFDSVSDIWFRQPENLFQCPVGTTSTLTPITFLGVWVKIILPCFLQSAGTAIGEIPPYWMARSARLAAMEAEHLHIFKDEDANALPEELEATSQYSIVNYLKEKMIIFLHTYGFYGVLLMASYPNLAFDLCGVCCGHFLMPFMTFFCATFIGKAIIRNSYQSFFYVLLCSEEYLDRIIRVIQHILPDAWEMDHAIRAILEQGRESFQRKLHESNHLDHGNNNINSNNGNSNNVVGDEADTTILSEQLMTIWNLFMTLVLTTFFLSCLAEFAQCYQRVLDDQDALLLRQRVPADIVQQIASPTSGRWHLPAPTPLKTLRKTRKSLSPIPALPPLSTPKKLRTPLVSFASSTKLPSSVSPVPFLTLPSERTVSTSTQNTSNSNSNSNSNANTTPKKVPTKVLFASPPAAEDTSITATATTTTTTTSTNKEDTNLRSRAGFSLSSSSSI